MNPAGRAAAMTRITDLVRVPTEEEEEEWENGRSVYSGVRHVGRVF